MNCDTGLIPIANVNATLTSGSGYANLAQAGSLNLESNLAEATGEDASPTTDTVYFNLQVPTSGVAGNCDGTIYFGATTT